MRPAAALFALSALTLLGGGAAVAQKEKDKAKLPAQNQLALDFADNPEKYKGKTVTFRGEVSTGDVTLRALIGQKGIPFDVYPPRGAKGKLLLGIDLPKGLLAEDVPNSKDGEEVVVTFLCEDGRTTTGNRAIAFRRPP